MMNGRFLLDTNIVIALFGNDTKVTSAIKQAEKIFIPSVVAGELFYGAYNSGKPQQNIQKIIEFCNEAQILDCNMETGRFYGKVKKHLKDLGKPIPENDIWIMALSLQHQLCVVSRDKHFNNIDELELIIW